ncbi:MAG: DUF4252 domain-containing protein [Bacteroidota bacterium]
MNYKLPKLLSLLVLLSLGLALQAQTSANAIDRYFQQYLEDERFSVVYISPRVFQLFDKLELGDDVDTDDVSDQLINNLAQDLRGLRILTTDHGSRAFYEEAKSRIDTDVYELLMTVRQGNSTNVEFMIYEDGEGKITELLLLAGSDESFTLISFVGNIDLNTINDLAREIERD